MFTVLIGEEFVSWLVEELKDKHTESDEMLKSNLKICCVYNFLYITD